MAEHHVGHAVLDPERAVERHHIDGQRRVVGEGPKRAEWRIGDEHLRTAFHARQPVVPLLREKMIRVEGREEVILVLVNMHFRGPDPAVGPEVGGLLEHDAGPGPRFEILARVGDDRGPMVRSALAGREIHDVGLRGGIGPDERVAGAEFGPRDRADRRRGVGTRRSEIGRAIRPPGDGLHAGVAIRIAQRIARDILVTARVIHEQVGPAVGRRGEAVVTGAVNVMVVVRGKNRHRRFRPGFRIEQVGVLIGGEQAEAIFRTGAGGGVGDENAPVPLEHGGSFVDRIAHFFPGEFRLRQEHLRADDRGGAVHFCNIEVGVVRAFATLLCPDKITRAAMREGRGVEGKRLPVGFELAAFRPVAGERVGRGIFEDIHADGPDLAFFRAAGGEVDVPFAVDEVDFRRPDVRTHRAGGMLAPDDLGLGGGETGEGGRAPQFEPIVLRHSAHEVIIAVGVVEDERVGALADERIGQIVRSGGTYAGRGRQRDDGEREPSGEEG